VTQFYVCNLNAGCDKNSPDSSSTSLDNVPWRRECDRRWDAL